MFNYSDHIATARRVARTTVRNYPGVDADDLTQEILTLLWADRSTFAEKWDTFRDGGSVVRKYLQDKATAYCRAERARFLGLHSQYAYTPDSVRTLLETVFTRTAWPEAETPEDAKSLRGNDGLEMSADVARVYDQLSESDRAALLLRYGLHVVPDNGSRDRKRLDRAVTNLTDALNSYAYEYARGRTDGLGSRHAMTNARAHAMTGQLDG